MLMLITAADLLDHLSEECPLLIWRMAGLGTMQVNLILTAAPYTPDKRGDRSVFREGVREDVTGAAILLPDMNLQDLTKDGPTGLIALLAQVRHSCSNFSACADQLRCMTQWKVINDMRCWHQLVSVGKQVDISHRVAVMWK